MCLKANSAARTCSLGVKCGKGRPGRGLGRLTLLRRIKSRDRPCLDAGKGASATKEIHEVSALLYGPELFGKQ